MRVAAAAVSLAFAAACSPNSTAPHGAAAVCRPARGETIAVSDVWVRPAAAGQPTSAVYFTICNAGDAADSLVSVSSPVANMVEVHRTSRDQEGIVSMAPAGDLELPPGVAVALEPAGTHVMLMDLTAPIEAGGSVRLTLHFERSKPLSVKAVARVPSADELDRH
jgi:copper(I)-binding protein